MCRRGSDVTSQAHRARLCVSASLRLCVVLLPMASRFPRSLKRIVPILVICGLAYTTYAASYVVGYNQLFRPGRTAAAVALWVLLALFEASLCLYWLLLLFRGPTKCAALKPFDLHGTNDPSLLPLPRAFVSDKQGYPFWCGKCHTIKPTRLFHLNDVNHCCARFDHYCVWVGTAIGRDNQIPFIKFVQFCNAVVVVILPFVALTTRRAVRHSPHDIPHYVVLYVLCGFWIVMTLGLLAVQVVYITRNWTTLDELTVNEARKYARWDRRMRKRNYKTSVFSPNAPRVENGKRYINVHHAGTRAVVPYNVADLAFSQGFQKNLVNLVLNRNVNEDLLQGPVSRRHFLKALVVLLVPYVDLVVCSPPPTTAVYENFADKFSPDFLAQIDRKIKKGDYIVPLYAVNPLTE